jgi:MurNAc alpha-1-phosphate uridylyltransferase
MPTGRRVNPVRDGAVPRHGMILAAGLGLRMRPLTETLPKPLISVAGRTLLDRAIDHLEKAGVENVIVNAHYLAEKVEAHVRRRSSPRIVLSVETERLETGGGVARALPLLGGSAFFVVNGDALWIDGLRPTIAALAAAWNDERMDGLLLLHSTVTAHGYDGMGDFLLAPDGRLTRRPERTMAPYMFAGVQILHPRLFDGAPDGPFSLNVLFDRSMEAGRLFGVAHEGAWFHVGTPEDLAVAERLVPAHRRSAA